MDELLYTKSIGRDPLERIEHSVQDVIRAVKRARSLYGEDVRRTFHDTDRRLITPVVRTNRTKTSDFGDVATTFTERELRFHLPQRFGESRDVLVWLAHEPKRDPLRGLGPDAGEPAQFVDDSLQGKWVIQRISSEPGNISVIK
jgi:hypothetical protein